MFPGPNWPFPWESGWFPGLDWIGNTDIFGQIGTFWGHLLYLLFVLDTVTFVSWMSWQVSLTSKNISFEFLVDILYQMSNFSENADALATTRTLVQDKGAVSCNIISHTISWTSKHVFWASLPLSCSNMAYNINISIKIRYVLWTPWYIS